METRKETGARGDLAFIVEIGKRYDEKLNHHLLFLI